MQLGSFHLTLEERERRKRENLCLNCSQSGHLCAACPERPPHYFRKSVSDSALTLEVQDLLIMDDRSLGTRAMIDSGAMGNFIDLAFARARQVTLFCLQVTGSSLCPRQSSPGVGPDPVPYCQREINTS